MKKKNIVAIIQARLTSSRFPNKIIQKINNKTLIELLINRLEKSKYLNKIVLAVPKNKKNKLLSDKLKKQVKIFSGSENDVLDRYFKAAKKFKAETIVRICGDCPLIDPKVVDKIVNFYQKNDFDYVSNTIKPTYPDGLDVEVFNFATLKTTWIKARSNTDREHVTQFIISNKIFKKKNLSYKEDLSNLRLTIDEKIDLKQIKQIYHELKNYKNFGIEEIKKLYKKKPKIFKMNTEINRNEGLTLNTGQKLWKRAKNIIPGGNMLACSPR